MAIIKDLLRIRTFNFRRKNCEGLPPDLAPCSYGGCRPNEVFFPNGFHPSPASSFSSTASSASTSSSTSSSSSDVDYNHSHTTSYNTSYTQTSPLPPPATVANPRTTIQTSAPQPIIISSYSTPAQVPILSIPKPRKKASYTTQSASNGMGNNASKKTKMTLVEIFQSQGCSSCPPANGNVIELMNNYPSVLLLTYEVTYWDYLGWKDSFGNKDFDRRQRDYAATFGNESVFTPQVVVNGRADGVGNTFKDLNKIVSKGVMAAANEDLTRLEVDGNSILISGGELDVTADVHLVRYMPKPADVNIRRGENAGRCIPHRNVVVDIKKIGEWKGGSMVFNIGEETEDGIERAVLLQKGRGGAVIGAAKLGK
ncbi:hypothetical protein Dda_7714 [Drechslerella dactyloides]|uniref:DUF1223-domain-containing protein n=1 Tax=Drechslerella dactyloides TaxID=74499 RepID=A0AAD6ISP4_DREDA|nr:hypothetical protein Dda_7714 [Drechslerella dactyloides]